MPDKLLGAVWGPVTALVLRTTAFGGGQKSGFAGF
jgi:hypothetical protein